MTGWPVLEIELLWIVSLFDQDLANTCQIHQNTPITCHHKFQLDECIWKSTMHCIAFPLSLINVLFTRLCLLQFLQSLSPHDTILTGHQAFAPSGPMLLLLKSRLVRVEFCLKPSAKAWQETHDLRSTMKHTAHSTQHTSYRKHAKISP